MADFAHIHERDTNLQWNLFSYFSTFTSLVQGHLKASNHLSFFLFLYSEQSGARPEPRETWHHSDLRLSYNILNALANSHDHTSRQLLPCCTWTCHPCNLCSTSTGDNLCPVYFRKWVHFLLCHLCNLFGMSKGSSNQYPTLEVCIMHKNNIINFFLATWLSTFVTRWLNVSSIYSPN